MNRGKYCKICGLYGNADDLTGKRCATCTMPISKNSSPIILILSGKSKFFCWKKCLKLFLAH